MGIYTDLLGIAEINNTPPRASLSRTSWLQLQARADRNDPTVGVAYAAGNEVAVIPEQTDAAVTDTYTLSLKAYGANRDVAAVVTAAIAFDAVDTVIETAIDVAMTAASFPSWTNGDITVTMGGAAGLDDGIVTLTFDGASVAQTPVVVELTATGFTATEPITRTAGSTDRKALQALVELNVVAGTLHDSPNAPTDWIRPASTGHSRPRYQLIHDLAAAASREDGTDEIYNTVAALYPDLPRG